MPSSGVQKCALDRKSTRLNSSHTIISLVAVSLDRKSTRLNSSHTIISYAVFCLKKKTSPPDHRPRTPSASSAPPPPSRRARRAALGVPLRFPAREEACWVVSVVFVFFLNDGGPPEISPFPQRAAFPV